MDCDELIDEILEPQSAAPLEQKRSRLAAIVAGGRAKEYFGKNMTTEQVDSLSQEDLLKLYGRYEARLGASMTKTLGSAVKYLYACVVSSFLPIRDRAALEADLEKDPFVDHAVNTACCELYHRYGMYLAPLTAALTTAKHCQFEASQEPTHNNGDGSVGGDNASDSEEP